MLRREAASQVRCCALHRYNPAQALSTLILPVNPSRQCALNQQRRLQSTDSDAAPRNNGLNSDISSGSPSEDKHVPTKNKRQRWWASRTIQSRAKGVSSEAIGHDLQPEASKSKARKSIIKDEDLAARIQEFQEGRVREQGEPQSEPFTPAQWRKHIRLICEIKHLTARASYRREIRIDDMPPGSKEVLDYPPVVLDMTEDFATPLPWRQHIRKAETSNAIDILGEEIVQFMHYIQPTPLEISARMSVYQDVVDLVQTYNRRVGAGKIPARPHDHWGTELFGSSRNGLAYCTSDLDVRVTDAREPTAPPTVENVSGFASSFFKHAGWNSAFEPPVLRNARFPSITTHHPASGLDVQLVCNQSTHTSMRLIEKYSEELPAFKPLYHILRQILRVRGADDGYHGGLTSYPLAMMIVAFLKQKDTSNQPLVPALVATSLVKFLGFYGNFRTRTQGLTVDPVSTFHKQSRDSPSNRTKGQSSAEEGDAVVDESTSAPLERDAVSTEDSDASEPTDTSPTTQAEPVRRQFSETDPLMPYLLCLEDPALKGHDLGSRVYAIKHIQATFRALKVTLKERLKQVDSMSVKERLLDDSSLLLPLVGRLHEKYEARRAKLQAYGLLRDIRELGTPHGGTQNERGQLHVPIRRARG